MGTIDGQVSIDFTVRCDVCKEEIDDVTVLIMNQNFTDISFYVAPCQKCLQKAREEGRKEENEKRND